MRLFVICYMSGKGLTPKEFSHTHQHTLVHKNIQKKASEMLVENKCKEIARQRSQIYYLTITINDLGLVFEYIFLFTLN